MSAPEIPSLDPDRVRFESLTRTENGLDLRATDDPDNGVILGMAEAMAALLGSATNYVECEVIPSVGSDIKGSYTMIVQRRNHPTPHELRRKAEQERDDLQARWDARDEAERGLIERWRGEAARLQASALTHPFGSTSSLSCTLLAGAANGHADELERAIGGVA